MRLPDESINLISGQAISPSSVITLRDIFPLQGEGWRRLRITLHNTIVIGTGADPNVLGSYLFLKNINLRTNRNENPISIPAMGLYYLNFSLNGVEPVYTNVAAASATYDAVIDVPFVFPFISRKEDFSIDSGRYNMVELELQFGSISDLIRTPGTATMTSTLDLNLIRNKSCKDLNGKPVAMPYIKHLAPFQAVTKGYADIESAEDLILFGFIAVAHDLVTWGTVGNAFEGDPADCLTDISFYDNLIQWIKTNKVGMFQEERSLYSNNRAFTGVYPWIFSKEGSYKSGLPTGNRSEIKFLIGNGNVGAPTTPQVDLILFGTRELR